MFNREIECLEGYPYHVNKMNRGRGGVFCHCEEGLFLLKEYDGNSKRVEFLRTIQEELEKQGFWVDTFVCCENGEYIGTDRYGGGYTLRKWVNARECDPTQEADILEGIRGLARLSFYFQGKCVEDKYGMRETFLEETTRHNREMKSISNYVKSRRKKSAFEELFRSYYEPFYQQAKEVEQLEMAWKTQEIVRQGWCHREYTHHNLFFREEGLAIVHFDNLQWGYLISDLALYIRKILEKNNWSIKLGEEMLATYEEICPMKVEERKQLYLRLSYPVRFLKVVNHYSSTKKSWVSMRDCEKLLKLAEQERERQQFLEFLHEFVV